jgi:hypothetical protein
MIAGTGIRKIGMATAALLVIVSAGARSRAQSQSASPTGEVSKLRILYVGHPGSDREKDFVQFLGQHFETVKTADLGALDRKPFTDKDAEGVDVTIFDYDGDGFKAPRPKLQPRFVQDEFRNAHAADDQWFTRPLITVGVVGGLVSDCGLKIGYS